MVAPSFEKFEFLCEPYEDKGRMYIKVRNPKTGTERTVRWYDEKEYAKAYPEKKVVKSTMVIAVSKPFKPQKPVLGFASGPITIFAGVNEDNEEWFRMLPQARYCVHWGWYIVSEEQIPEKLPYGVRAIPLPWSSVGDDEGYLKRESDIKAAIEELMYEPSKSEFYGSIGERLELHLDLVAVNYSTNFYGKTAIYSLTDKNLNEFEWKTKPRDWSVGDTFKLKATIVEHFVEKGHKITRINRCTEI